MLDWAALIRPTVGSVDGNGQPGGADSLPPPVALPVSPVCPVGPEPSRLGTEYMPSLDTEPAGTEPAPAALNAAFDSMGAALGRALELRHPHFFIDERPAWTRRPHELADLLRAGGAIVINGIVRCCLTCRHRTRPGLSFPGYCGSRPDLLPAYGSGHPLRELPADAGAGCPVWAVCPYIPAPSNP